MGRMNFKHVEGSDMPSNLLGAYSYDDQEAQLRVQREMDAEEVEFDAFDEMMVEQLSVDEDERLIERECAEYYRDSYDEDDSDKY